MSSLEERNGKGAFDSMYFTHKKTCICYRTPCVILCAGCGFMTKGRSYRTCPSHPAVVYLFDFKECPYCLTPSEWINEYPN